MASKTIGTLIVSMKAETASFSADLGKANQISVTASTNIQRSLSAMSVAIGVGLERVAEKLLQVTTHIIGLGEQMNKAAQKTGLTVESFTALRYAANIADVDTETLSRSLGLMAKSMMAAATGTDKGANAYKMLGVAVKDSSGHLRAGEDVLADIAEKFRAMPDGMTKSALAVKIFGRSGREIIPLLNSDIKALTEEAKRLGVVMSTESAAASEQFMDSLKRLKAMGEGLAISFANGLLPALNQITDAISGVKAPSGGGAGGVLGDALIVVAQLANATCAAFGLLGVAIDTWWAKLQLGSNRLKGTLIPDVSIVNTGNPLTSGLKIRTDKNRAGYDSQMAAINALAESQRKDIAEQFGQVFDALLPKVPGVDLTKLGPIGGPGGYADRRRAGAIGDIDLDTKPPKTHIEAGLTDIEKAFESLRAKVAEFGKGDIAKLWGDLPKVISPALLDQYADLLGQLSDLEDSAERSKQFADSQKALAQELMSFAKSVTDSLQTEGDKLIEFLDKLDAAVAGGALGDIAAKTAAAGAIGGYFNKDVVLAPGHQELLDALDAEQEKTRTLNGYMEELANTMTQGFQDAILRAKSFGDVLGNIGKSIAGIILNWAVMRPIQDALLGTPTPGGGRTGGWLAGIGGFLGGVFGGPKAAGGPVFPGMSYLVGERGPELFTPGASGNISASGAGGNVYVDARGADPAVEYRVMRAMQAVYRGAKAAAQFEMLDSARRTA